MADLEFYDEVDVATTEDVADWFYRAREGDELALGSLAMLAFYAVELRKDVAGLKKRIPKRKNRNAIILVLAIRAVRKQLAEKHHRQLAKKRLKQVAKEPHIKWRDIPAAVQLRTELSGDPITDRAVRSYLKDPRNRKLIEDIALHK